MTKIEWFDVLVDLDASQRAQKLQEIRLLDADLAAQLERLLALDAADADQPDTLESQLGDQLNQAIAQTVQARTQIGSYRLLGLLGQGGMGEVWRAERDVAGNKQPLALKILKLEDMSAEAHERFALEQRTLLKLVHPNIARLLDAGVASDGRPWIAMELVEGVPITQYCDQHQLSINARLALFRQVIAAVQYAHDYFIVHRDIKPDNVLVDQNGTVKLLDFGIAKSLDRHAPHTLTQQRFFSLYATAPEQLLGSSVCVGTDVYALGGLLYELLSGAPLISRDLKTPAQLQTFIVEKTPTLPSRNIDTAAAANRSAASIAKLSANLRGDLDRIVLHALRKLPSERYASAREFDEDIHAFLEHRPVKAAGQGRRYRAQKFLRRHWLAASISGLALASLLALTVLLAWRGEALALETSRANIEAKSAGALSEFWQDLFATADPNQSKGKNLSVRDVLDAAVTQLSSKLGDAPVARATLLLTIAKTYRQLSAIESAKAAIEQASLALASSAVTAADTRKLSVEVLHERARILADAKDSEGALSALAKAKLVQDEISATPLERALTLNIWASVLIDRGEIASAIELLQRALALRQNNGASNADVAMTMNNLAFSFAKVNRLNDAKAMFATAYALRLEALGEQNMDTALTLLNLGRTERELGNFVDADNAFNKFFVTFEGLFPDVAAPHPAMIDSLIDLGISLRLQDRTVESINVFDRAVTIAAKNPGPARIGLFRERAATLIELQRYADAKQDIEVCLIRAEKNFGQTNATYARCLWIAAKIEHYLGKSVSASEMLQQALVIFEKSNQSVSLDYAQALIFQADMTPALASSAKIQAKKLLAPLNDYWLARQLLVHLD